MVQYRITLYSSFSICLWLTEFFTEKDNNCSDLSNVVVLAPPKYLGKEE